MSISNIIKNIVSTMVEYQAIHNIKGKCVTNVQILYDIIRATDPKLDIKIKAVMVIIDDYENNTMICNKGHLVLDIGNKNVLDPSYEVASFNNSYYFTNVKDFINFNFKNYGKKQSIELWDKFEGIKKITEQFMFFVKKADEMNNNEFYIDKSYYNNLCDYIQEKHKHELLMIPTKV